MENTTIYKCRLCLSSTSNKIDVFKQDFPKMIELLTGIKVDANDGLPKESCLNCAKDVKFCMSVRKQILQSHKVMIKQLLEQDVFGSGLIKHETSTPSSGTSHRLAVKKNQQRIRSQTPDSTTDEEDLANCNYSDNESISLKEDDVPDCGSLGEDVVENITLIHEYPKSEVDQSVKCEETETTKLEVKTEHTADIKEPLSLPPLSPERLLRKRNMIAASNRFLKQENSMGDRRYSNVIFVRKSMRDRLKKQADAPKIKKQRQPDDSNVIWKNGKKYAACEICKREVKKHYLKHHMTTHFPEHFSCDVCGVTTRNLRGLRYHKLYWHSSKLDYICDKCGKKYRSKHALDLHNKKEHGGIRDLECNICGKKFFQKMHLKRHVDGIHKKLRPHKCEYCGKDFTKRTHLVTHWRTHTNETPYGCDMCGERFKLKLSLKNHLRRVHNYEEKERVFCDVCNRGFATEQGLRAHINSRVHEGEKCQYCSESFTPEYLKTHLREVHFQVDFY
ncbi:GDNF-inducible zinc finger protein 1 [Dendroctonus ponderosae]|uniref:Protein krueppel n=1 Tax=Dendroctonus ponderosae TaxID=77166 RepID=U4UEQ0_DENPD|nr:GDNF-inducible zinc finger protein 1 [Dendroctonus ponderosae]ERL89086.1 hypothetical protein D910_06463 [Dendroctonus ponderosae]KAH1026465.1 hypothetical protein HUJ05_000131 [Dendroctonus ponderosae]